MSKIITRLLPLFLLILFHPAGVGAQQPDRPPNLNLGDAVVTGFSGSSAPNPTQPRPANKSAIDLTFINPDGPSARIVGMGRPGFVWDGRLFQAPKTFDVLAKDTGQLFGVALDDQAAPNIYLAATSAFGLHLVGRGRDGLPERRKVGGPGTGWMKGQFGLDLQGDPGSIYKVDGTTGAVTLFTKVMLDGVPNPGPALGNLAYDVAHKQLFVSDLYTGMIHRFVIADGSEPGPPYDHGVTGRGAANLAPMPFNPGNRPNIANSRFNSENPDTWGFAPPERRVWGLAVQAGRLFYSARNGAATEGPQIWSVGVQQDGSFAADARWELDVPAQPGPYPVSDIAFSQKGAMILAQRAPIAGSYDYSGFTKPGEPRVLRYWLKDPNDPPSPGRWRPLAEEYAVGFAGNYRNTNGGVDLGYGYGRDGTLSAAACEFALWTTAQNMRNAPPLQSQLQPGGPLVVHGIFGVPAAPVRSFNEPPWTSYSIDYDDKLDDPGASGHMGSVRILKAPCTGPVAAYGGPGYAANPPYISGPSGAPGTPGTPGTPGSCVGPNCGPCPYGTYPDGTCVPPKPIDLAIYKLGEANHFPPFGGFNFTLGVESLGAPFAGTNVITVTDVVPAGMTFTSATGAPNWSCPGPFPISAGGTLTCTYIGPGPTTSPQALGTIAINATGTGPGPFENCATVGVPPTSGLQDSNPANNTACVTVQPPVGSLIVKKTVTNNTPGTLPSIPFPMTVTCGPPSMTVSFSLADGGSYTVNNIVLGSSCTVAEVPPPPPPNACPQGTVAVWSPPPTYTPPSVVISGTTATITVHNTLRCEDGPVGSLVVTKTVTNNTPVPLPSIPFPMTVTCGPPSNTTVSFLLTDGGSHTVNNILLGSSCTVAEVLPPPPNVCPQGTVAVWSPPPTYSPPGVAISGTTATITVHNTLRCEDGPVGSLTVTKIVSPDPRGIGSTLSFPMTLTCMNPTGSYSLTFQGNSSSAPISNLPVGSSCTIAEPALPLLPLGCTWLPPHYSPQPAIIAGGMNTVTLTNSYTCALLVGPAGQTPPPKGCAPPMVPGPVPGTCVCSPGTVQKGRECVRPIECRAPQVPNQAGTACVCPAGTLQQGRSCVQPTVCNPPAKLNSRGICQCPTNMVAKGKTCVEREGEPVIVPRGNPGIGIPGIGFPGGGPRGGGPGGPGGGNQGGPGRR